LAKYDLTLFRFFSSFRVEKDLQSSKKISALILLKSRLVRVLHFTF